MREPWDAVTPVRAGESWRQRVANRPTEVAARRIRIMASVAALIVGSVFVVIIVGKDGVARTGLSQSSLFQSLATAAEQAEAKKLLSIKDPVLKTGVKTGEQIEAETRPLRAGGLGVWLGRGQEVEKNVYSEDYLDDRTNAYYGQDSMSEHAWHPEPEYAKEGSHYYNVLAHWKAKDPMEPPYEEAAAGNTTAAVGNTTA